MARRGGKGGAPTARDRSKKAPKSNPRLENAAARYTTTIQLLRFLCRMGRKKCPHVETMEKSLCAGSVPVCPQDEDGDEGDGDGGGGDGGDCPVTSWSEWSPCSVSCGEEGNICAKKRRFLPSHLSSFAHKTPFCGIVTELGQPATLITFLRMIHSFSTRKKALIDKRRR